MVRDFSENAENKLIGQIRDIETEQWSEVTDLIGDHCTRMPNIQHYLDRVNEYHKKILDKKNFDESKIRDIFRAVRDVDTAFQSIFSKYRETLREQKEYIEALAECIDVSGSNFNANSINKLMSSASEELSKATDELNNARVDYYFKMIRIGEQKYDFEHIREIMLKNPEDVPPEQYAAMITAFNEMNTEQKAKFIECAYIQGEFYYDVLESKIEGKYEFKLSGVFSKTVDVYTKMLNKEGMGYYLRQNDIEKNKKYAEWIDKFVGNHALLKSINTYGGKIFVSNYNSGKNAGDVVKVKLEKGPLENDYVLQYNGSSSAYIKRRQMDHTIKHTISTFGMQGGEGILSVLIDHGIDKMESLKIDITKEKAENASNGIVNVLLAYAGLSPDESAAITTGSSMIESMTIGNEGSEKNRDISRIQKMLGSGKAYPAFSVSGSVGASDGSYQLCSYVIDVERLDVSLEIYAEESGGNIGFTSKDISNGIKTGYFKNEKEINKYVEWYHREKGDDKTDAEMQRRYPE